MKKTYIAPAIAEMNIEAESMIAASIEIKYSANDATAGSERLDGGRRGEWGNLWNK
ncbi:MAG: hypothetical protein IJ319_05365 [Bacteroidaceae bacterium]|nr:hypothetical protein [Bacteroidaceae bacterium]